MVILIIPASFTYFLKNMVKDNPNFSELMKVVIAVVPSVVFMNIIMCTYVIRAMRDPLNYQPNPPLKMKLKAT
jgi:hypothetical protein